MPYYLFKISNPNAVDLVKKLELVNQFDAFRNAKSAAKTLRMNNTADGSLFKVIFAENQLGAEELLLEKREKPVLMEYER